MQQIRECQIEIQVPFHDVDSMGVVWHGHYFKYFEIAREMLLNQLNFGYRAMSESKFSWPIIDTGVKYRGSIIFEQRIIVKAELKEYENRLKINYIILDKQSGKKLTTGYTVQVAVDINTNEICFETPSSVLSKMGLNHIHNQY